MATEYASKINGKKILAERASYTEGGTNIDEKLNGLGTAATKNVPASGDASSSQVVMGNDTRLSNSRTPTSHTHGNIQNGGTLQTSDVAIAKGDKLVITDSSDSNKVARSSVSFDASTTTKALTPKGTFEPFYQKPSGGIPDTDIASASTWSGKQNALAPQTAYTSKGTATKVPQISTNSLGQVTGITEVTISGVTPASHASSATTYGAGTTSNYGHVKLATGDMNGASNVDGVAVSKNHTHSQYESASNKKQSISDTSTTDFPSSKAVAEFVNSSIATNTANFLGTKDVVSDLGLTTSATNTQIATALKNYTWPTGVTPTNNDYVFVSINLSTTTDVDEYRRFKYTSETTSWAYEFTLNNSSFTQAQWNAINSGLTSTDKTTYDNHVANTTIHVTSSDKSTWNGKQDALTTQTAYTSKGSATKVPQITTNSLGQVTGITEVTIAGADVFSTTSNGLVPSPGSSSYNYLGADGYWHGAFLGASSDHASNMGLVPTANAGDQNKFLKASGEWYDPARGIELYSSDARYGIFLGYTNNLSQYGACTTSFDILIAAADYNPGFLSRFRLDISVRNNNINCTFLETGHYVGGQKITPRVSFVKMTNPANYNYSVYITISTDGGSTFTSLQFARFNIVQLTGHSGFILAPTLLITAFSGTSVLSKLANSSSLVLAYSISSPVNLVTASPYKDLANGTAVILTNTNAAPITVTRNSGGDAASISSGANRVFVKISSNSWSYGHT